MSDLDLKNKYRPKKFKKFLGNYEMVEALQAGIEKGNLPHALLFYGPRGCGKTTIGRVIGRGLGVDPDSFDFYELDTAVYRGIDKVRSLRQEMIYGPRKDKYKIYLLDEAHMLGRGGSSEKNEAQNALLKALEEPPDHIFFILCTTNPEMLLKTIRDRCTEYKVNPLDDLDSMKLIKFVARKEKLEIPRVIIKKITRLAEGHPRGILSLMSKIMNLKPEKMSKVLTADILFEDEEGIELCRALIKGKKWPEICGILKGIRKKEPESIRRTVLEFATTALLGGNKKASLMLGWFLDKPTYDCGFPLIAQYSYNITNNIAPPC